MHCVSVDQVDRVAAAAIAGELQLFVTNPADGVSYRLFVRRDVFAQPVTPIGSAEPRSVMIMMRLDGAPLKGTWAREVAAREHDFYGAAHLAAQIQGTLNAGGAIEAGPLFGPHQLTNSDRIWAWDTHADAFRDAYRAAWESRDWPAVRAACHRFRDEFPTWALDHPSHLRDSACTIARNMRGESHPPRWHAASRYRRQSRARGFAHHAAVERATLEGLRALRETPGFASDDRRQVIPIVLRYTGKVRHVLARELFEPRGRFLYPVKPDGSPMPRTASIYRSEIAAIKSARVSA